jgi:hypothetical protein
LLPLLAACSSSHPATTTLEAQSLIGLRAIGVAERLQSTIHRKADSNG